MSKETVIVCRSPECVETRQEPGKRKSKSGETLPERDAALNGTFQQCLCKV